LDAYKVLVHNEDMYERIHLPTNLAGRNNKAHTGTDK